MVTFIQSHIWEWIFTVITATLAWCLRNVSARLKEEQKKNEAISEGIQALLRENIVNNYNKYSDKGYMPIYAKESLKRAYTAYKALGGNDVASELYNKMLKMKEEQEPKSVTEHEEEKRTS